MGSRDDGFTRIDAGAAIVTEDELSATAEYRGRFSDGSERSGLFVMILLNF